MERVFQNWREKCCETAFTPAFQENGAKRIHLANALSSIHIEKGCETGFISISSENDVKHLWSIRAFHITSHLSNSVSKLKCVNSVDIHDLLLNSNGYFSCPFILVHFIDSLNIIFYICSCIRQNYHFISSDANILFKCLPYYLLID